MESVETLLTKALEVCKTPYRLSKITGQSQGSLSGMRRGKRPVPPALAGQLAAIIGEDAREATLLAVVSQEKTPERQASLAELLGVDWRKR